MSDKLRATTRRFAEDIVRAGPPSAFWTDSGAEGSCNGCHARGRVALIRLGTLAVRICASCLNTINEQLGAFK